MRAGLLAALFIMIGTALPASAQTFESPRAGNGSLGAGGESGQALTVSGLFGATFFDILDNSALQNPLIPKQSLAGQGVGTIGYLLSHGNLGLAASADSIGTYYPSILNSVLWRYDANLAGRFAIPVTSRTRINGTETVQYSPSYLEGLPSSFDATIDPTILATNLGTTPTNFLRSSSLVGVTHAFTRRTSFAGDYTYDLENAGLSAFDSEMQRASARIITSLSQHLSVQFGYAYSDSWNQHVDEGHVHESDILAGLDYGRALSLTRHTTLTFGAGATSLSDTSGTTRLEATGRVVITHEMGRTWSASAGYYRDAGFVGVLRAPVVSDTATGTLAGQFTRRLQLRLGVAATRGTVGFGTGPNGEASASGTGALQFALSRYVGAGVSYAYYYRNFESGVFLPGGLPPRSADQAVQMFATVTLPVFHRMRPHATR